MKIFNALIINGHPNLEFFNFELVEAFKKKAMSLYPKLFTGILK